MNRLMEIASGVNRARRLMTIALGVLLVFIGCIAITSYGLYTELVTRYIENYTMLSQAGLENIVAAPGIVEENVLFLILTGPLVGLALVFPLFFLAAREICFLYEEVDKVKSQEKITKVVIVDLPETLEALGKKSSNDLESG